ncbi:MAG: hypothetical protein WC055_02015 [Melioribacteraceae bacterium]
MELISEYSVEVEKWRGRKEKAVKRANEDLSLIVPLVEEYYEARRPVGDMVVYSWNVKGGVEGFKVFLNDFLKVCVCYPGTVVKVSR